jgi:hypothetical protein
MTEPRRTADVWMDDAGNVKLSLAGLGDPIESFTFHGDASELQQVQDLAFRWVDQGWDGFRGDRFTPDDDLLERFVSAVAAEAGEEAATEFRRRILDEDER